VLVLIIAITSTLLLVLTTSTDCLVLI
jgi:hypothetical protein